MMTKDMHNRIVVCIEFKDIRSLPYFLASEEVDELLLRSNSRDWRDELTKLL